MLSIPRQNVNVRISNRFDNIVSEVAGCLFEQANQLERLTWALRYCLHPVSVHVVLSLTGRHGSSKRLASGLMPCLVDRAPQRWRSAAIQAGTRLSAAGPNAGTTQLAG